MEQVSFDQRYEMYRQEIEHFLRAQFEETTHWADLYEAMRYSLLAGGNSANFVTFTKGTTVQGGTSGSEHLTSFDYAYKLESVRDWLFAQSK